jgi:hypothetical protein
MTYILTLIMTEYGTSAKVIGMYKDINFLTRGEMEHVLICKTDLNKYITIHLINICAYESCGRHGIVFQSHLDLEIEEEDEDVFLEITHLPIKEHFIDLTSINRSNFKCEIFQLFNDFERGDDNYPARFREYYTFNEDLFAEDLKDLDDVEK